MFANHLKIARSNLIIIRFKSYWECFTYIIFKPAKYSKFLSDYFEFLLSLKTNYLLIYFINKSDKKLTT